MMLVSSILEKGKYQPIDKNFLLEGNMILEEVAAVQEKFNKKDTDTFINELRDSMVGYYLGYDLVNTEKHGFDCKLNYKNDIFLEVKSASITAKTLNATFNDTTIEKAKLFQSDKVFLSLAIWKNANNLLFIAYGKNESLGTFLEEKVRKFLNGTGGIRSTQSISLSQLIFDYGFDIICINKSKDEIKQLLKLKSRKYFNIPDEKILTLDEFGKKYDNKYRQISSVNKL